ncbi:MAG: Abi family protein [Campylobacterota bacterium]|nr:Abi family protein [Campylobacterota bacterium]
MSNSYSGIVSTTEDYLNYLYSYGFYKSKYLKDSEIITICNKAGVFKLKGYVKEISHLSQKNIDDVLIVYLFDRYFSKTLFDLTVRIESKLKSILISESYKRTSNHFFYLMETNHKWNDYNIDFPTISNWKVRTDIRNPIETYSHYILFYLQNYNFTMNQRRYLNNSSLINIDDTQYNYPPFKYLIESATLGSVISFIRSLKIGTTDIYSKVADNFGLGSNHVFKNYLERLNEIRNRVAHGGRIFNRTFRSATGIGKYRTFRLGINNHKSLDVYLFLFFMLNKLEGYNSMNEFKQDQLKNIFEEFKQDFISNKESFELLNKYKSEDFEYITEVILKKMSI